MRRVLFVCVENSCRSQMAEGFARAMGSGVVEAWSAGSRPSGKVNETAIRVMKEKGIDLSLNSSKSFSDLPILEWDYVVTMGCGDECPFVPGDSRIEWKIPDPRHVPIDEFRAVRDALQEDVRRFIEEVRSASP